MQPEQSDERPWQPGETPRPAPTWPQQSQQWGTPSYPPPPEYFAPPAYPSANWQAERPREHAVPPQWQGEEPHYAPLAPTSDHPSAPHMQTPGTSGTAKALSVGRALLPIGSAAVSLAAYAALYNWPFAIGIMLLLLVHEMGHFVVIRAKGLPASLPIFIPLVGAFVTMRRLPNNVRDEAEIAIAGPMAGALGGLVSFGIYQQSGEFLYLLLAYFSFLLNLLNLVPVSPLDGGRIVGAISRWIWPLGLIGAGVAFFYTHNFLLLLLLWFGLWQTISLFRSSGLGRGYYRIGILPRIYITALYFGLAAALALGVYLTSSLMFTGSLFPF